MTSDNTPRVIESNKPFSKSMIWEILRKFYIDKGIEAWSQGLIPFYITNSTYMAFVYTRMIEAFLRDIASQIDPSEPIYILEVGAGSGRLAYQILREIESLSDSEVFRGLNYRYILTDLPEKNIGFWQNQPQLEEYVQKGVLDFGRYDVIEDSAIHLLHSNKTIHAGTLKNPVIAIANYVLDSLPMDLFYVEEGYLSEVQASIHSDIEDLALNDPALINKIRLDYTRFPATSDFYHDEELKAILEHYREKLADTMFLMPYTAINLVRKLLDFANNRLMLITADAGGNHLDEIQGTKEPDIEVINNGLYVKLNFHAIIEFFQNRGGQAFIPEYHPKHMNVPIFVMGEAAYPATKRAYTDFMDRLSPQDHYFAVDNFEKASELTATEILAFLRQQHYDPYRFILIYKRLMPLLKDLESYEKYNLRLSVKKLWDNYYHIGEKVNVPYCLATVLQAIADYAGAITLYEAAIDIYGDKSQIRYSIAICHLFLGRKELALKMLDRVIEEMPNFEEAQRVKAQIGQMKA